MLKKLGLGLMVLSISSSSFALELYKAKLIGHKESTTGGITAKLKNGPSLRALSDDNEDNTVYLGTYTKQQSITLGKIENIPSDFDVFIRNDSDATQEYDIYASTCVKDGDATQTTDRCFYSTDTIRIEPNGSFENSASPELLVKFNEVLPLRLETDVEIVRATASGMPEYLGTSTSTADITTLQ